MAVPTARAPEAIRPRPVFCVIEGVQASRAVAEDARRGRFTHCGLTLDLGVEPDWTGAGLPSDREWRIEWTKFYWGLDLARAFGETDDVGYLEAWERLVGSWIRAQPPDTETHVVGRRIQNWIYAWDAFARSPAFPGLVDGLPAAIARELGEQVAFLMAHLTPQRNHRTLELYALFVASLALPELDPEGDLLDFTMDALHANLRDDLWPDGVQRECSTHYHMLVLRSFLAARENARRFGLSFPPGYDERLGVACEFAMHAHRPDGAIPAISDSDTGSYADLLLDRKSTRLNSSH